MHLDWTEIVISVCVFCLAAVLFIIQLILAFQLILHLDPGN